MAAALARSLPLLCISRTNSQSFVHLRHFKRLFHCSSSCLDQTSSLTVRECYTLLGLHEGQTDEADVRSAYFKLAKRFHPDSGQATADPEKFARIDHAYRVVLAHVSKKLVENTAEESYEDKFDIRHTAPQHRRYLEYGGAGTGTPSMREKQHQQRKVEQAFDNVYTHKTKRFGSDETSIAQPEKKAIKKGMISNAIERMVEDLIQEAMSKGEFKNLPGSGKPLISDPLKDPYMDSTTHRLNKVLIDAGYVPDWIALEKEIRNDIKTLKVLISQKRASLGPMPFTVENARKWTGYQEIFNEKVKLIDGKIDNLNLIVPILSRQKAHINLEMVINKIFIEYGYGNPDAFENRSDREKQFLYIKIEHYLKICINFPISWISYYGKKLLEVLRVKNINKN